MDSGIQQLMRCLREIHKIIAKANTTLAGISQPSVCREVLLSTRGTAYVLALAEIYWVSQRLENGMKARQLDNRPLRQTLCDVNLAWNNLLAFLAFGPSTFQMLNLEPSLRNDPCPSVPSLGTKHVCGVCLAEMSHEPQGYSGNSDPVTHQGTHYHTGCANFWLNCVDPTLPGEA